MYLSPYDFGATRRDNHIVQVQSRGGRSGKDIEPAILGQARHVYCRLHRAEADPRLRYRENVNYQTQRRMREQQDPERGVKDKVAGEADAPESRVIDARDDDLASREFQELAEGALTIRGYQALRNEYDPRSSLLRGACHRVVVAHRASPGFKNLETMKRLAVNGGRSAPGKVAIMVAENPY